MPASLAEVHEDLSFHLERLAESLVARKALGEFLRQEFGGFVKLAVWSGEPFFGSEPGEEKGGEAF